MKKISIIIPVYNAMTSGGGYITRAVDSVLNQKNFPIEDIEILLINDGSKDNSLEVLQEIARKNQQTVRLIDQQNMGVANTRNKAMELATAEYTTFLDQDDWLDEDFFATLYSVAHDTEADVVASGFRRPDERGNITKVYNVTDSVYGRYMLGTAWAKLHRTEFLRQNNLKFFVTGYGEDIPFSVRENILAKVYKMVPYVGYNWYQNEKSVSNTSQKQLSKTTIEAIKQLIRELCNLDVQSDNQREYNYFILRQAIYCLLYSGRVASRADFLSAKTQIFDILEAKSDIFLRKNIHKLIIPPRGESLLVGLAVSVFIIFDKIHAISLFALIWCKKPKTSEK